MEINVFVLAVTRLKQIQIGNNGCGLVQGNLNFETQNYKYKFTCIQPCVMGCKFGGLLNRNNN